LGAVVAAEDAVGPWTTTEEPVLVPSPKWLDTGDNAWQLAAATFVALQSIPGLTVLYGGVVKKKWAINSAFMSIYAFASVLVVWVLFDYNMAFGPQWYPFLGTPMPALSAAFSIGQATIPAAAAGMPPMTFPMATLVYFQFVFAAITVIILAGSVLGRMSFKAWVIFCPVWMTLSYTVGAFSLWGGGWLAALGVVDFSGGYVIHLAAATSGFVAAAMVGPRLQQDREHFPPNSLLITLVGGGILWLGWNGFNGGDPYFANADAGAAVLNTNTATACAVLVWTLLDKMSYGKPSVIGAVNGMIAGLVAITPAAGYVNGWGAIIIGVVRRHHPVDEHELVPEDQADDEGRRHPERVLDTRRCGHHRRPADWRVGLPRHAGIHRHRQGRAGRQRHWPDLRRWRPPAFAAGLWRALHHRVQRHRHLHHPQGDLVHHPAADG
jgi:ammonium transporter